MAGDDKKMKKEIIYNAVMDGWKVRKLKTDKIELTKAKKNINENIDIQKILKELIQTR